MPDTTVNTPTAPKRQLDEWAELIRRQEMPIFDQTVRQVISISHDDSAPISALARVVLQDASLTARALKLANSIYYNPLGSEISTITRAIVVLGFNAVRNMCLALTLVDALVTGAAKERLGRELARTIHAATQARALASARDDKSPEEIFIATLLSRIGELAFWCFSGETGDRLEQLSKQPDMTPEQAQETLLGFRLNQLSRRLIREWRLTELLQEALAHPSQKDERIQTLLLGQQIAQCAEAQGWRSEAMNQLTREAAKLTRLPLDETRTQLYQAARAATAIATDLGARFAAVLIPQPNLHSGGEGERDMPRTLRRAALDTSATPTHPLPDSMLQIKILRELESIFEETRLEEGKCDFNGIMELVLEGIYRGVGMDRVLFALITPDKQSVKAKYALGEDHAQLTRAFSFGRDAREPGVLFETMESKLPRWVSAQDCERLSDHIPGDLVQIMGRTPFLLAPTVVNHQCIGIFYADRGLSQRPLDADIFADFKHFVQQANMGLTMAASRHR